VPGACGRPAGHAPVQQAAAGGLGNAGRSF